MSSPKLVTDRQGLWVANEARRLGISATDFQGNRGEISAFLASLSLSPLVLIDRSKPLVYPVRMDKPLHYKLEATGPNRLDVSQLEHWLNPEQKYYLADVGVVYNDLKRKKLLPRCLGFRELLAIQAKGPDFFRRYFSGQSIFCWKGAVKYRNGDTCIPCLVNIGGNVILIWRWLGDDWSFNNLIFFLAPPISRQTR